MNNAMRSIFGILPDGTPVERYTLQAGAISCKILTYGGILQSLLAPDREGRAVDVVLGFDTLEDYLRQDKYMGALVGRCANRIAGGHFSLDGTRCTLAVNNGPNHLHGGLRGFSSRVWTVLDAGERFLSLSLESPDGEEGYPGNLAARVVYRLSEAGLTICYSAAADRATPCNLTNHTYFNLDGEGAVLGQTIQLFADRFTPTDAVSIPTGEIAPVDGTPMDLRRPTAIGAGLDRTFSQLQMAGGYDHNWVLNGTPGTWRLSAEAASQKTGIALELWTTLPGVQFYTGNFLTDCPAGKGGAVYEKHSGFCLETQFFPDAPNHPDFPSCILRPGQVWNHATGFYFRRMQQSFDSCFPEKSVNPAQGG